MARIVGTSAANFLAGTAGSDYILGMEGDDFLSSSGGRDFLNGSSGNDTADYSNLGGSVYIDLERCGAWAGKDTAGTLLGRERRRHALQRQAHR